MSHAMDPEKSPGISLSGLTKEELKPLIKVSSGEQSLKSSSTIRIHSTWMIESKVFTVDKNGQKCIHSKVFIQKFSVLADRAVLRIFTIRAKKYLQHRMTLWSIKQFVCRVWKLDLQWDITFRCFLLRALIISSKLHIMYTSILRFQRTSYLHTVLTFLSKENGSIIWQYLAFSNYKRPFVHVP